MTKISVGYASDLRRTCVGQIVGPLAVVFLAAPAAAGGFPSFDSALTDCVNYVVARPTGAVEFQGNVLAPDVDEEGISGNVLYPVTAGGGDFEFGVTYEYAVGNSITAPSWTCGGAGRVAPTWPVFTTVGWSDADARIRAGGLVELDFPGGPKAYANCGADVPDLFLTLSPAAGDRVVFAALTGQVAAAYCTSLGVKE